MSEARTSERRRKHDDEHRPAFVRTRHVQTSGPKLVYTKVCPVCRNGMEAQRDTCTRCGGTGEVPQ